MKIFLQKPYIYICAFFAFMTFSSCVSKKEVLYFQDIDQLEVTDQNRNYSTIIRPNDLLSIVVSGPDPLTVAPLNPIASASAVARTSNDQVQTYLVDSEGSIEFPLIGTVTLGGNTRAQAVGLLKEKISVYVKNPTVNMRIVNFSVSVLGEVQRPGTFTIPDERITVLEALGLAGDMTIFGERATVKVIREEKGLKTYGELDFRSIHVVNSPFYYLQQNDVVVVSPNKAQVQSSGFNRNSSIFISIAGILISVIAIFIK